MEKARSKKKTKNTKSSVSKKSKHILFIDKVWNNNRGETYKAHV